MSLTNLSITRKPALAFAVVAASNPVAFMSVRVVRSAFDVGEAAGAFPVPTDRSQVWDEV